MILLKKQKKELFDRIGRYASAQLRKTKQSEELLYTEVCKLSGLPANRVSEIVNKGFINDKGLIGLLTGGLLDIEKICEDLSLNEEEAQYLRDNFVIFGDRDLLQEIRMLKRAGQNPAEILRKARLKLESRTHSSVIN